MRKLLFAAAFSLLAWPPAFAQSCADWCLKNRCRPDQISYGINFCMSHCVPACEAKHGKMKSKSKSKSHSLLEQAPSGPHS